MLVGNRMSKNPVTVGLKDNLATARTKMREGKSSVWVPTGRDGGRTRYVICGCALQILKVSPTV